MKLCECGCGQPTKIITKTSKRDERVIGEYSKFIYGHHARIKNIQKFYCRDCGKLLKLRTATYCWECYNKHRIGKRTGKENHMWQGGEIKRICEVCGKEFLAIQYRIKIGKAKFCSKGCANKGENSHWYGKKHVSPIYKSIRHLSESKQWRSDIFQRDNWICRTCGVHNGCGKRVYLEAHHIKALAQIIKDNNITNTIEAKLCKELWDIDNGVTLCKDCHKLTNNYAKNINNKKEK